MLIWIILNIVPMLFGLYAQMKIRSAYSKNVEIPSRGHIRGAEAAAAVLLPAALRTSAIKAIRSVSVAGVLCATAAGPCSFRHRRCPAQPGRLATCA